ncbi:hypothetical protein PIB30_059313 [Stylosanthes scabra]|uniref:Uncharacterized protein n=1 Tax=Stylosanthes scabra TaxID=79078 RepID=A0ABU6YJ20_9FABA|nr:hypothetical protein [Stylosanthes scabra]
MSTWHTPKRSSLRHNSKATNNVEFRRRTHPYESPEVPWMPPSPFNNFNSPTFSSFNLDRWIRSSDQRLISFPSDQFGSVQTSLVCALVSKNHTRKSESQLSLTEYQRMKQVNYRLPIDSSMVDSNVLHEIPNDDDGSGVDPTMIDVFHSLSSKIVDVNGTLLTLTRVIIPLDFNEVEKGRVYRWVIDDEESDNVVITWYKAYSLMKIR